MSPSKRCQPDLAGQGLRAGGGADPAFALPYTVFSEWLNTEVRGSWAYADIMPIVPVFNAGLSPVAQWVVIPIAALWWARRPTQKASS